MKLYATTTSERASKGQGGNEYLNIAITSEDGAKVAKIVLNPIENTLMANLHYWDNSMNGYGFHSQVRLYVRDRVQNEMDDRRKQEKKGWSECNHYATDGKGLCARCGYNTLGLTSKELKGKKQ